MGRSSDEDGSMSLNPPTQYATDANFRARQRLWKDQQPPFDIVSWVLDVAALRPATTTRVLDIGCGNGAYLTEMRRRGVDAVGCDLSQGMLAAARPHSTLANADVTALPFCPSAFDVVLAAHMLYHVADREAAAAEMRLVLRPGGRCVVVTNGKAHMQSLRALVETAVQVATPGWEMRNPSIHVFSLENGEEQLRTAFQHVATIRPPDYGSVVLTDASIAADFVASVEDHYQPQTTRPWHEIVEDVRDSVQREIESSGAFVVRGETGAFICE